MTREEAIKLVEEEVKKQTDAEYPYWLVVEDTIDESECCFFVEAIIYADGEDQEECSFPYIVYKKTGEVTLPGGITIDVNELGEIVKPEKKL